MGWSKRQLAAKRSRTSLGMLEKFSTVPDIECRQAEYLMKFGSGWVKLWWRDHPGQYSTNWTPAQTARPRQIIHADMETVLTISEVTLRTSRVTCVLGVGSIPGGTGVTVGCLGPFAKHLAVGKQRVRGNLCGGKGLHFSVREVLTTKPMEAVK